VTIIWFVDCCEELCFLSSSLVHQSTPEQSARSRIDGRHFGAQRPIDSNALLLCAWMMSEGCVFLVVHPFLSLCLISALLWSLHVISPLCLNHSRHPKTVLSIICISTPSTMIFNSTFLFIECVFIAGYIGYILRFHILNVFSLLDILFCDFIYWMCFHFRIHCSVFLYIECVFIAGYNALAIFPFLRQQSLLVYLANLAVFFYYNSFLITLRFDTC
jgi:hypothetical protein